MVNLPGHPLCSQNVLTSWTSPCPSLNPVSKRTFFEKKLNLYLDIPPHSAHTPRVLRGLIIAMISHIYCLTTNWKNKKIAICAFFLCLSNCGYASTALWMHFAAALAHILSDQCLMGNGGSTKCAASSTYRTIIKMTLFPPLSKGALEIAKTHKYRPRTKHLNVKLHHFQDYVNRGEILIHPIDTTMQQADYLTKPVNYDILNTLRPKVMGW
jgi:hypothetical protein